jgi:hypothetical protein
VFVRRRLEPADGLSAAAPASRRGRKSDRPLKVLVEPDENVAQPLVLVVGQEAAVEQFVRRGEDAGGDARIRINLRADETQEHIDHPLPSGDYQNLCPGRGGDNVF